MLTMAGRTAALAFALGPLAGATAQAGPDAVARAVAEWPRRDTGRVQLRVDPVLPDTVQSASWLAAVARASEDVGPRLEVTADVLPPILLVASRERMEAVAGVAANGLTDFRTPALLLVYSEPPNQLAIRHELGHWLVAAAWAGPWPPAWIHEGMATWAQGECSGAGIRAVAVALADADALPALSRLVVDFRELPEVPAYLAAGSLVGYLASVRPGLLRVLWRHGLEGVASAIGRDATQLEVEWRQWLTAVPDSDRPAVATFSSGCRP